MVAKPSPSPRGPEHGTITYGGDTPTVGTTRDIQVLGPLAFDYDIDQGEIYQLETIPDRKWASAATR